MAYMVKDGTYSGLSMEVARDSIVATYRAGVRHISRGEACSCGPGRSGRFPGQHGRGSMPSAKSITWECWHGCNCDR